MTDEVLLKNDKFKVTRSVLAPGEKHTPSEQRDDRVIIYDDHSHIKRHTADGHTEHKRAAGEVVYREASDADHTIENVSDKEQIVYIIERS